MLVSCLPYSLTLKMAVILSSEMYADFQQTMWHQIMVDRTLQNILPQIVMKGPYAMVTDLSNQDLIFRW
jgi:hypothetical protein